jgi:hypothetical protein
MKRSIESASYLKRCEIAELASGNIQQHWFFVRRAQDMDVSSAIPSDLDAVPVRSVNRLCTHIVCITLSDR